MIRESVSIVDKRVPLLVGTAAENTYDAIKFSVEAQKLKADGVMIIPPFYSTPTEEEMINHFRMISNEIDIPIMVYNNPATSNVDILPETFAELSKIKNVKYLFRTIGELPQQCRNPSSSQHSKIAPGAITRRER